VIELKTIGLQEAEAAIAAGKELAQRYGRPMAFVVADRDGQIIASARTDGTAARNMRQAIRKAHTAAVMGRNTLSFKRDLEDRNGSLPEWGDPALTTLQGGYVVKPVEVVERLAKRLPVEPAEDLVLGAVACGGAPNELDEDVARAMLRGMGFKPVADERLMVFWNARPAPPEAKRRTVVSLPLAEKFGGVGQEPVVAARVGNLIMTSGVPGIDMRTGKLPEDPVRQFALAYENLRTLLETMGVAGPEEIAHLTVFIPDAKYRQYINRGWMELYPEPQRAARKTNQVPLPKDMVVQLQAIAVPGESRRMVEIPGLWHRDPLPMAAQSGPYLFSSVISPQLPGSGLLAPGGAKAQLACAFENVRILLNEAGGSVDDINHMWVFLKDFTYQPAMLEEYLRMFPEFGQRPARKTVPYDLPGDTQIQIQLTAMPGGKRRNFEIEGHSHHDPIPMASATGGLLQSSGISGIDPRTNEVPDSVADQCRLGMVNIRNLLEAAGGTLDDVVSITILVRDLSLQPIVLQHLRSLFPDSGSAPAYKFVNYQMPGNTHAQFHVTALLSH
jgi:2-iminobutanoate/2-iminopropanoate deaminase